METTVCFDEALSEKLDALKKTERFKDMTQQQFVRMLLVLGLSDAMQEDKHGKRD